MNTMMKNKGFTLIEIAIVLMIVTILLGYTLALFPVQQELKQYRTAEKEMAEILQSIIGFAQINGRLPCPALPDSVGIESGGGEANCDRYGGFVPVNTLGLNGKINGDSLLLDPWGNPYRYYVTNSDFFGDADSDGSLDDDLDGNGDGDADGNDIHDFVRNGEMRNIGLSDVSIDEDSDGNADIDSDGYIDLDPNLIICDRASGNTDRCNNINQQVIGDVQDITPPAAGNYNANNYTAYAGATVVLLSLGKNGSQTPTGDELENRGSTQIVNASGWGETAGPTGNDYFIDTDTVFVKRITGQSANFDDLVKWISPNVLFSKMIEAGQLP